MTLTVTSPVQSDVIEIEPRKLEQRDRRARGFRAAGHLPMIAFDEVPPTDRNVAVNGPLWDSHVIPTVEITTTEVADRRRVLAQASRRAKRNEADQALINDLRGQLERAEHMAECKITELANFHQGAEDMRRPTTWYS